MSTFRQRLDKIEGKLSSYKCFLLIDLKPGKLTHQDVGQMDTYVRVYDELHKGEDDK